MRTRLIACRADDAALSVAITDGDGLPDAWEVHTFGRPDLASEITDTDVDGLNDASEYVAGTCPTSPETFRLELTGTNAAFAVSVFGRRAQPEWYGTQQRLYRFEGEDSLATTNWFGLPGLTNVPGEDQWIKFTNSATSTSRYYRAKVWLQ